MDALQSGLIDRLPASVRVPHYLDDELRMGIVHFGVGNFHRSHQAMYMDRLLAEGIAQDWAICGVGLLQRDVAMRDTLSEQDGLYTLVLRHPDGSHEFAVIGSIREFIYAPDDPAALLARLCSPETRIVSLTVTEGGYVADPTTGRVPSQDPLVAEEVANGLTSPLTAFGWIVAALRLRRDNGIEPFTVLSCDNIQGNGHVARASVEGVARLVDPGLAEWISSAVAFPSTMVDRITPVTTQADIDLVETELGVHDDWPVASEPFTQWIIEDWFPYGRPPFEEVGATLVRDIDPYEAIKLRLLNGSHQALAYIGQLMGYVHVHDAVKDPNIARYIRMYMENEVAPTLQVPDGFDIPAYIDELFVRFGNPHVQDLLSRLSVDASNRVPKFVVPVLYDRVETDAPCTIGASIIASWRAWCRGVAAGRFSIDDAVAEVLTAAAVRAPVEFLNLVPALQPLVKSSTFVSAFVKASEALEQEGPVGLLASLSESE